MCEANIESHTDQLRSKLVSVDTVNHPVSNIYKTVYKKELSDQPKIKRLQQATVGKNVQFGHQNKGR